MSLATAPTQPGARFDDAELAELATVLGREYAIERELGRGGMGVVVALHGETMMADLVARALGLALLEPTHDWLPALPETHRRRRVEPRTLGEARGLHGPVFVKPVDEKWFPARCVFGARRRRSAARLRSAGAGRGADPLRARGAGVRGRPRGGDAVGVRARRAAGA